MEMMPSTEALPEVAAGLAIERISRDVSFDRSYSFEYVILNEDCQTPKALSSFIFHQQMASGFVGPANPGYYEDIWVHTANRVSSALQSHGLPVGVVLTTGQDSQSIQRALQQIRQADRIRIIIMCMHSALIGGETQTHFLELAHDLKMTDGTYVFVPYDVLLYSLPYKHTPYQVLRNNQKLREAYDAVLTITMDSHEKTFYEAYSEAAASGEIPEKFDSHQRRDFIILTARIGAQIGVKESEILTISLMKT
ncbi:hypothetical protein A6R68_23172 [Neotoma lepida]|uniref:Receptor ligand binding region domain-containing protein n=1 Tax=Neotoma lepida TaxID=56216 RepID=A0A1A6HX78_NEOLE|nr:hypothetical protein A6R68_23172 [Neotoma lepida]